MSERDDRTADRETSGRPPGSAASANPGGQIPPPAGLPPVAYVVHLHYFMPWGYPPPAVFAPSPAHPSADPAAGAGAPWPFASAAAATPFPAYAAASPFPGAAASPFPGAAASPFPGQTEAKESSGDDD